MENNKATAPIQKNNKQAKMRIEKKQTKKLSKSNINNPLSNGQNIMSYFVPKLFNTNDKRSLRF
mgnify:CR=1 FL=1